MWQPWSLAFVLGACQLWFPLEDDLSIAPRGARIAAGAGFGCAIDDDDRLFCWGLNVSFQAGAPQAALEQLDPLELIPGQRWASISAGDSHACAVNRDRTLWCWGQGRDGQLGSGEIAPSLPVMLEGEWESVSAGGGHTCGLRRDRTLACWGANDRGQLGDGTMTGRLEPGPVVESDGWLDVAAGGRHTCALDRNHDRWCWGANDSGQLGDNSRVASSTPTLQEDGPWGELEAGDTVTCGLRGAGELSCWGDNRVGQLGDGTVVDRLLPAPLADPTDVRSISVGRTHTCATRAGGSVLCWGDGSAYGLGSASMPVALATDASSEVAVGRTHTCVMGVDGVVSCVGDGSAGQLGNGQGSIPQPQQVQGTWKLADTQLIRHGAGSTHSCAINTFNELACWGSNLRAELGIDTGDRLRRLEPIVRTSSQMVATVRLDLDRGCAVTGSPPRRITCWGDRSQNETLDHNVDITTLAIGIAHGCIRDTQAQLHCWGDDGFGQLGNGTGGASSTLQPVLPPPAASTWKAIAAGAHHTCGIIDPDPKPWCWGSNAEGQLGLPDTSSVVQSPQQILSTDHDLIYAGRFASSTIDNSGLLVSWGLIEVGNGIGAVVPPELPFASLKWLELAIGDRHVCGIQDTKTLWCWGANERGQLGDGTFDARRMPRQVGSATNWDRVSAGAAHTCATADDNTLWCWGDNSEGQLGTRAGWSDTLVPVNLP